MIPLGLALANESRSMVERTDRLDGRAVLVTGGAQGIGRAVADRFASEGAFVVLMDHEEDTLTLTVSELTEKGLCAQAVAGDVANRHDVHRAVTVAASKFGGLYALVAVAGISEFEPFLTVTDRSWNRILDVNLTGMFLATQEAAKVMVDAGEGVIVLIGSTNGFFPEAHTVPYSVSKAGVIGLAKAAALDLAPFNIRVNAINPGQIATRSSAIIADPVAGPAFLKRIPLGRWGRPQDIAGVALFLASDDAAYLTGEDVTVDAGMTIGTVLGVQDAPLK